MFRRRCLSQLLGILLLFRALFPAGYMLDVRPSSDAGGGAVVGIKICTANGMRIIKVDADGLPLPADQSDPSTDDPCAFAALADLAVSADVCCAGWPPTGRTPALAANDFNLPPIRAGPALGARGPPQLS